MLALLSSLYNKINQKVLSLNEVIQHMENSLVMQRERNIRHKRLPLICKTDRYHPDSVLTYL